MNIGKYVSTGTLDRLFNAARDPAHKTSLTEAAMDYKNSVQKLIAYLCCYCSSSQNSDVKANAKEEVARAIRYAAGIGNIVTVNPCYGKAGYLESRTTFSIKDKNNDALYFKLRQINGCVELIAQTEGQADFGKVIYTAHNLTFNEIRLAKE